MWRWVLDVEEWNIEIWCGHTSAKSSLDQWLLDDCPLINVIVAVRWGEDIWNFLHKRWELGQGEGCMFVDGHWIQSTYQIAKPSVFKKNFSCCFWLFLFTILASGARIKKWLNIPASAPSLNFASYWCCQHHTIGLLTPRNHNFFQTIRQNL